MMNEYSRWMLMIMKINMVAGTRLISLIVFMARQGGIFCVLFAWD